MKFTILHPLFLSLVCPAFLLLAACQSYDFKVNDKVVYTPHPLFKDFDAPDQALHTCLEQAIADDTVTASNQLSSLNCSHAGIADLDGLASFTRIKTLRLSSNSIRNLVEISALSALEELYLDNNKVIDPVPLYQLPALNYVDFAGNPDLQCPHNGGFAQVATVILPQHCR